MNKKFFYTAALALALFAGASTMKAQNIKVDPLTPEVQAMANQIVATQMENPDEANKVFTKLFRKVMKDKSQSTASAKFFLDNKVYPCAKQLIEKAYELDAQNVNVLMLYAEVAMMRKDYGTAGQKYDEIVALEPNNIEALKRRAFIYKNINPTVALEDLQKVKQVEPTNLEADKEMGDIYYKEGEYAKAIEAYKPWYDGTAKNVNDFDIRSGENYVLSLFSKTEYATALKVIDEIQPLDPKDLVFHRMKFFCNYEEYNITSVPAALKKAEEAVGYITSNEYDSLYVYLDFLYAANLFGELEKYPEAIKYMQKGLALDGSQASGYKTLADLLAKNKQTDEALETYAKYMDMMGDGVKNIDIIRLSRMYGAAAREAQGEKRAAYLAKGNSVLDKIEANNPGSHTVSMQRARLYNVSNEPDPVVKKFYEEALTRSEGKEDANDARAEAYNYLLVYAIQKDEYDDARKFANALLKIDPTHEMGLKADGYLKKMGK